MQNNRSNSWTPEKNAAILRQLRDVTNAVELLDRGICELEAKQLDILTAPFSCKKLREEANFLTAMNNSTADSIKRTLREIEDVVNTEMEGVLEAQDLIKEFIKVLRKSIRTLQDYRLIQQSYVDELNKRVSISPMPYTSFDKKAKILGNSQTNTSLLERFTNFVFRTCCHCFT